MRFKDLIDQAQISEQIPAPISTTAPAQTPTQTTTAPLAGQPPGGLNSQQAVMAKKQQDDQKKQIQDQIKQAEQQLQNLRKQLADLG